MNPKNVPNAKRPNCHAMDSSNPAHIAANKHPKDKHAIAKPLVKISMIIKTNAATIQICQISISIIL